MISEPDVREGALAGVKACRERVSALQGFGGRGRASGVEG